MTSGLLQRQCLLEFMECPLLPLPYGRAWLGITLMHLSLLFLIRYFGFGVFSIGFSRYLHMGEVLLGATHLMFHVYVGRGGLQLCVENKIEEGL